MLIRDGESGLISVFTHRTLDGVRQDIYSPYGLGGLFLWGAKNNPALFEAFKQWMAKQNIVTYYLMTHPEDSIYSANFKPHRSSYELNLVEDLSEIWKNLHKNHKYEIKKFSRKEGFTLSDEKESHISAFSNLYSNTLSRINAGGAYHFKEEFFTSLLSHPCSKLLSVWKEGEMQCAVLCLTNSKWADYFLNAASPEGKEATRYLLWEMIKSLKSEGIERLHLGGGVKEGDDLDNFKRRFGGKKIVLKKVNGVINNEEYQSLCSRYQISENDTDYFPPYWQNQ